MKGNEGERRDEKGLGEQRREEGEVGGEREDQISSRPSHLRGVGSGGATDGHLVVVAVEACVGSTLVRHVSLAVGVVRVYAQRADGSLERGGKEFGEQHLWQR